MGIQLVYIYIYIYVTKPKGYSRHLFLVGWSGGLFCYDDSWGTSTIKYYSNLLDVPCSPYEVYLEMGLSWWVMGIALFAITDGESGGLLCLRLQ